MRKLNLFIALTLLLQSCLGLNAFAQVPIQGAQQGQQPDTQQDQWYEISNFSPGLQSHVSSYLTPKGAFLAAQNVRFNENYGAVSKRSARVLLSSCHAAPVESLYRFYKDDQTKYTIQTSGSYLTYVADLNGACTDLLTGLNSGSHWTWLTYKNDLIGTDGIDRAVKWDGNLVNTANTVGSRTAGYMASQLGAAFAQQYTGTDLTASKWYQYKVAYYDGEVYKFSNARSNPLLTGTSVQDISLSDIPLGPIGTTSRLIYRTLGQTSATTVAADNAFYLVATIADNSTRTFNDTYSDATISSGGGTTPTWSTVSGSGSIESTPPFSTLACIHSDYLFFANDPSGTPYGKSTVYFSALLDPDYFTTATDYVLVRPDDGDQITSLSNFLTVLTISKENSWQQYYTNTAAPTGWTLGNPMDPYGCVAPYSSVVGTGGIYYLSRSGLRTFNGQSSTLISDVVSDKISDIKASSLNNVVGAFQNNQYFISYTSQAGGSSVNDTVLMLDLVRNAYTEDTENISSFALFGSGTDTGILYSGASDTTGSIYALSQGYNTLIFRYLSDLNAGTFTNTQSNGTEQDPYLTLGSMQTWAQDSTNWTASPNTWIVDSSPGTWITPVIEIDASTYVDLYWNETLQSAGNITFAIRGASTSAGVSSASWSSEYSTATGSDLSALQAYPFIQLRATLSTTDYTQTPGIFLDNDFLIELNYNKGGLTEETTIPSYLNTGYTDLGLPINPYYQHPQTVNIIKEVQIHYTGTAGIMTVGITDDDNKVNLSFPIDLSVNPSASGSAAQQYYGTATDKIYDYIVPITDNAVGRKFAFTVTENGNTDWQIRKISVRFDKAPYTVYQ